MTLRLESDPAEVDVTIHHFGRTSFGWRGHQVRQTEPTWIFMRREGPGGPVRVDLFALRELEADLLRDEVKEMSNHQRMELVRKATAWQAPS